MQALVVSDRARRYQYALSLKRGAAVALSALGLVACGGSDSTEFPGDGAAAGPSSDAPLAVIPDGSSDASIAVSSDVSVEAPTDVSMAPDATVIPDAPTGPRDATDVTSDAVMDIDLVDVRDVASESSGDAPNDRGPDLDATLCGSDASCDDGNPCTVDSCDPAAGCRHVERNRCGEANCSLGACAGPDTDGDGFSDAWEDADYIDLNCNGVDDPSDFHFPHRASHVFGPVTHVGSGQAPMFPTATDPSLPIASSTIVITVATGGALGNAKFSYSVNGGAISSSTTVRPVVDIPGNIRLVFYADHDGVFKLVAGDKYTFTTSMTSSTKVADKNVPNVYVQYDYMDFSAPGAVCVTDDDCSAGGNQLNDVCHLGACNHNHFPVDPLYRQVVDSYAAHGTTLYIDPVHHAVPHAKVVTFSKPGDGTSGAQAACAGADVIAGDITTGGAVNFHDIKNRNTFGGPFDPARKAVYRYAVLGHFTTCVSSTPGNGYCGACPADRATPGGLPVPGATGTSELPGNDFIVSLGGTFSDPSASTPKDPFIESGTFMHELGHTLGLHHFGDRASPQLAPNYLSVMNYSYATIGIAHASAPGGTTSVEVLREINYSEHTLATLVEQHLVEADGMSPTSAGYTGIASFFNSLGGFAAGPESGPVDWSGNGGIDSNEVVSDLNFIAGASETFRGYRDWDHPSVSGGACTTSADCRINAIRQAVHDGGGPLGAPVPSLDPHEPCVRGVCQSLLYSFQCLPWTMADGPPPSRFHVK